MSLPIKPKSETKDVVITVRLTRTAAEALRTLAKKHNLSHGEVVEYLVLHELETQKRKKD